jgi:hypothetical protein
LIAAVGLAGVRRRWISVAVLGLMVALTVRGLVPSYARGKQQWREATAMVLAGAHEGDAIVFHQGYGVTPFAHYVLRSGGSDRAPEAISPPVPWDEDLSWLTPQQPLERHLRNDERPSRVWLVLCFDGIDEGSIRQRRSLLDTLSAAYAEVTEERFIGIRVLLFE